MFWLFFQVKTIIIFLKHTKHIQKEAWKFLNTHIFKLYIVSYSYIRMFVTLNIWRRRGALRHIATKTVNSNDPSIFVFTETHTGLRQLHTFSSSGRYRHKKVDITEEYSRKTSQRTCKGVSGSRTHRLLLSSQVIRGVVS